MLTDGNARTSMERIDGCGTEGESSIGFSEFTPTDVDIVVIAMRVVYVDGLPIIVTSAVEKSMVDLYESSGS